MDSRDETTWVTLELTRLGEEKAEDGSLAGDLRKALGVDSSWPVFVPTKIYMRNGKRCALHLMQGYAFVASGLDEIRYLRLQHKSPLVEKVLSVLPEGSSLRVLRVIPNQKIRGLMAQMEEEVSKDVEVGARVKVTHGQYRGLFGLVTDFLNEKDVLVRIQLRSIQIFATIPRAFLEIEEG